MDTESVCHQFQFLGENCDLEITYSLIHCYNYLREKVIIYIIFDDYKDIGIKVEREKFEDIVDDLLLKNSGWYPVPSFIAYKISNSNKKAQIQQCC